MVVRETTTPTKEVTVSITHSTIVTPAEPETTYRDGAYRIDCSVCGTVATYAGEQFTLVEARRHVRFFASLEG